MYFTYVDKKLFLFRNHSTISECIRIIFPAPRVQVFPASRLKVFIFFYFPRFVRLHGHLCGLRPLAGGGGTIQPLDDGRPLLLGDKQTDVSFKKLCIWLKGQYHELLPVFFFAHSNSFILREIYYIIFFKITERLAKKGLTCSSFDKHGSLSLSNVFNWHTVQCTLIYCILVPFIDEAIFNYCRLVKK